MGEAVFVEYLHPFQQVGSHVLRDTVRVRCCLIYCIQITEWKMLHSNLYSRRVHEELLKLDERPRLLRLKMLFSQIEGLGKPSRVAGLDYLVLESSAKALSSP